MAHWKTQINRHLQNSLLALVISTIGISCHQNTKLKQEKIQVFCAAGLSGYINDLKDSLQKEPVELIVNSASSGVLARQIEHGANAGIFISASEKWTNYLDSLQAADTSFAFARNQLVAITSSEENFENLNNALNSATRIAIGDPAFVPAGEYAVQTLKNMKIFDDVKAKLIYTADVKSALRLAKLNECQVAFVYASDIAGDNTIKKIWEIADSLHAPINFTIYIPVSKALEKTKLKEYFLSEQSSLLLRKYGLTPLFVCGN